MTWLAPPSFTDGVALTAAQLAILSNDLLETAAGKATASGFPAHFATVGANSIAERVIKTGETLSLDTTSSETYTDIAGAGPQVSIATGRWALIFFNAYLENDTLNQSSRAAMDISGATEGDPDDDYGLVLKAGATNGARFGASYLWAGLNPGTHNFKMVYRVGDAATTGKFADRVVTVMGL